jgi:hypothetical protein
MDGSDARKSGLTIDAMEAEIPLIFGADTAGTMTITMTIDDTIRVIKNITILDRAFLRITPISQLKVGSPAVPMTLRVENGAGNLLDGFSSVANLSLSDGAGNFSSDVIRIRLGVAEPFTYTAGTLA